MNLIQTFSNFWQSTERRTRLHAGYFLIALLVLILAWSALAARVAALDSKRQARGKVLKELLPLKVAYMKARQSSDTRRARMAGVKPDDSPARIIEEIGIRGKGIKITPVKSEDKGWGVEESADVRIENLTANEAVNLFYRLENGNMPLILKKAGLKVRFDDQSRCDVNMTITLLKPRPGITK